MFQLITVASEPSIIDFDPVNPTDGGIRINPNSGSSPHVLSHKKEKSSGKGKNSLFLCLSSVNPFFLSCCFSFSVEKREEEEDGGGFVD